MLLVLLLSITAVKYLMTQTAGTAADNHSHKKVYVKGYLYSHNQLHL
jgi:hypothetical protein